jgi:hypothetical protein
MAAGLEAVDARHGYVEQDQVGMNVLGYLERAFTVRGYVEVIVNLCACSIDPECAHGKRIQQEIIKSSSVRLSCSYSS